MLLPAFPFVLSLIWTDLSQGKPERSPRLFGQLFYPDTWSTTESFGKERNTTVRNDTWTSSRFHPPPRAGLEGTGAASSNFLGRFVALFEEASGVVKSLVDIPYPAYVWSPFSCYVRNQ